MSRYKQLLRLCVRNKILRSANAKYHYSYLFFYKIYKGDLHLMYSCVFWYEFIDLVGGVWLLNIMKKVTGQTITARKKPTKSMNSHEKTQEYIKGKSPLFIL